MNLNTLPELEIVKALKKGDDDSFKLIFDLYYSKMVKFSLNFLYSQLEAEDIVQDFLLELWEKKEEIVFNKSINGYLFTSLKNKCLNKIKKLKIEDKHKHWLTEAQILAGIPNVEISECVKKKLNQALNELPEVGRRIFVMCVIYGNSYKEVSEDLLISVHTVKAHVCSCYKTLRKKLSYNELMTLFFLYKK